MPALERKFFCFCELSSKLQSKNVFYFVKKAEESVWTKKKFHFALCSLDPMHHFLAADTAC